MQPEIISPVAASRETITVSGTSSGETGDSLVINGVTVALGTIPASDALTQARIIASVNASAASQVVIASAGSGTNVTLTAVTAGYAGNSITTVTGGTSTGISFASATLTGGLSGFILYPDNKRYFGG